MEIGPSMEDQEWAVLQTLKDQEPSGTQRDIAQGSGLSLGLTNTILKQLIKKGFLTVKRINGRNLSYALTPEGMDAFSKKTYRYIRRTMKNVKHYKDSLKSLINREEKGVHLVGHSDLDFLIEYHCLKCGLEYSRGDMPVQGRLNILSEEMAGEDSPGMVHLRNIVTYGSDGGEGALSGQAVPT